MTDLSRLTDDELLAATPDDPQAYGVFYERHSKAVLGFLAQSSNDVELALDLTAEVFAAALKSARHYRPGEAPARAWLFGIARNKLLSSRRRAALDLSARRRLKMPDLQYAEIAADAGLSQAAIRQRVSRGLAKLGRIVGRRE